ncbi:universal stress protein [Longispora albida]|uniref:universal stress protein n=1 Tax=Longispora albida TaxID=203523 RepID=UPI0003777050|nr:universal stress protein [Longispora albida]
MSTNPMSPVIVGVDGSAVSVAALDAAAAQAAGRGLPLEIMLSYVNPALYGPVLAVPYPPEFNEPPVHIVQTLEEARKRAADRYPDLVVTTHLVHTTPAAWLVERSRRAAMVVVGSRGAGGFTGLLLGSVSGQVATHAHCPVMVVRGQAQPPDGAPVLVGVDGTSHSEPALDFAFAEASRRGVPLRAVYVWKTAPRSLPMSDDLVPLGYDQAVEVSERILSESLAGYREKFPDVKVVRLLTHDRNPAEVLLEEATGAAMVIVGSRGRGEIASLLLGSAGYTLIHHAECPVVIARSGTGDDGTG